MEKKTYDYLSIFKALSDETRFKILHMLSDTELCACNILEEFHITQPTLSYHMKILTECGLVNGVRDGIWMKYSLDREAIETLIDLFDNMGTDKE